MSQYRVRPMCKCKHGHSMHSRKVGCLGLDGVYKANIGYVRKNRLNDNFCQCNKYTPRALLKSKA